MYLVHLSVQSFEVVEHIAMRVFPSPLVITAIVLFPVKSLHGFTLLSTPILPLDVVIFNQRDLKGGGVW